LRCGVGVTVVNKDFLVLVFDDTAHVRRAAVAYFHVALGKDGVGIATLVCTFFVDEGMSAISVFLSNVKFTRLAMNFS